MGLFKELEERGMIAQATDAEAIEKLLDTQVYLELWVKVREDWRNKGTALKELGFIKEK